MSTSPNLSRGDISPGSSSSTYSGYPFPAQNNAGAQRSASGNRYRPRRGSTASSITSPCIGGSLDIQARRGSTVRETSQNAISTLLQPPIVRTGLVPHTAASAAASGYKAPTIRDIPPVTLTNIPHLPPENFQDYLKRIGPLFESFQRGRAESEQAQWLKKDKELEKTDRFAEALERRMGKGDAPPTPTTPKITAPSSLTPIEAQVQQRRRSSAGIRRNRNEPTPLSTIPNVYFDEDFHLENPRTFDVVSERAEIVRPPPGTPQVEQKGANGEALPPRKALATNAILQEKLSWYMDTVEVHLINSISTASTGFFAALGSLKELQTEAEESVAKIQRLREDLRRLDREVAVGGLEVAAKRRRRANLQKLGKATAQVQEVVENVKQADELVDEGSFDDAADQMDRVGRLVCGRPEPGDSANDLIDLRPLKALQGLDSGLQELQLKIGTGFANRFIKILMDDLRQHLGKVPSENTLKRWSRQRGVPPTYMETDDQFRKHLLASLKGLQRAGHTAPGTAAYREAVTKEMKNIIKKYLPSSSDDDADSMVSVSTRGGSRLSQQEKSSILARNLRALDGEDAEKLLVDVYTSVGEALRRVSTQTKILLDLTSSMGPTSPKTPQARANTLPNGNAPPPLQRSSTQEQLSETLDMSSLLGTAVDTAQTQLTRVLKVRNEQTIRLPKHLFLRYFTLNRLFADECEAVSGRGGQGLKGIINAQISGFVQVLGTHEGERIASALDSDSWAAVDFSAKDEQLLQRVLGAMGSDPPEWTQAPQIWEAPVDPTSTPQTQQSNGEASAAAAATTTNGITTPNGTPAPAPLTSTKATAVKPALIDGTRYILVPSATALLPTLDLLLSLTASIPSMTPSISTALLDVLKTFNSRSCQLILGAGATRSAGLKNITTKHLALASQALSFVIALVPYMRECARRHLPAGGAGSNAGVLAEFDKTKRLFQEHQSGIHDKLVEIMTTRSQAHVKALLAMDFSSPASGTGTGLSPYMETLTKETLTLHRVLSRHLGEMDVGMIMRQIAAAYREQWTKAFKEVGGIGAASAGVWGGEGGKRLLRDAEAFEARLGKVEGFEEVGREVLGVVRGRVEGGGGGGG